MVMFRKEDAQKITQELQNKDTKTTYDNEVESLKDFFRTVIGKPTTEEEETAQLLAQNSEERDQYYQDLLTGLQAGAGEFSMQPGQPEVYTGPTKEELFKSLIAAEQSQLSKEEAVTPDILKKQVDLEQELEKLPQIKPKPVIAEQPQPEEDKEHPKAETTDEPVFAEKPKSYYDIFDINLFRKGYNFHNPSDDDRTGEIWTGRYNEAMKIETPEILQNTVDRVLKAFPELNSKNKGNFYNEDFFIKLGKFESNAGQNLFNPKTRDYGMFQLNEDNLKRIFGDTKDFVNDTYKKGPKKGKKISAEEAKKRGKKANETFKNSFGVYYGKGIENITNITAEELKELFVKDRSEFLELIKNNHDVNLGIAISGSILPNLQK